MPRLGLVNKKNHCDAITGTRNTGRHAC
jgi:hypothetical protein